MGVLFLKSKESVLKMLRTEKAKAEIQYDLIYEVLSHLLAECIEKGEFVENNDTYQFYSREVDRLFSHILACDGQIHDIEEGILLFK